MSGDDKLNSGLEGSLPASGPPGPGPLQPDEAYPIRITRDGTWLHEGAPIRRMALVKLFASVLRRDDAGEYWLITPAERGRILVEDAPFVAVELAATGQGEDQELAFRTNLDDWVTAGPDHPIRMEASPVTGEPVPYILIKDGIEARLSRPVYYELVERGVADDQKGEAEFGIWSRRTFFPLGTLSDA
ncbi:MAG TPA: DUF1285 domain-containing protein [Azospirillaceae bacterium]|nr:DUF1285 domain-containing protein [Azospirillaceae bacterium]